MIPKIIHYCWYGGQPLPHEIEICIASWRKFCPDYTIKRWDETNSPMDKPWMKQAFKHRKWAFMADYCRFHALYKEGGIYMDTDMLLKQGLDIFLNDSFFMGEQDALSIAAGIIGAEQRHPYLKHILDYYDSIPFDVVSPPIITHILTALLEKDGYVYEDKLQRLSNGIVLYPTEYFYPIHYTQPFEFDDIDRYCTHDTYGVHLWNKSWSSEFDLLEKRQYKEGFKMMFGHIRSTPLLPFKYYKKAVKYILRFLFRL